MACDVEFWNTFDPTLVEVNRAIRLQAYRDVRDQLKRRIEERFTFDLMPQHSVSGTAGAEDFRAFRPGEGRVAGLLLLQCLFCRIRARCWIATDEAWGNQAREKGREW